MAWEYFHAVWGWFGQRFGWQTQKAWLVKTPGAFFALAMTIRALTQPGDAVLIQPPVYYPFFSVIEDNGRTVVENQLVYQTGIAQIEYAFPKESSVIFTNWKEHFKSQFV